MKFGHFESPGLCVFLMEFILLLPGDADSFFFQDNEHLATLRWLLQGFILWEMVGPPEI